MNEILNPKGPALHPNAPGMAAFTLVNKLLETLTSKGILTTAEANQIATQAANANDAVPESSSSTNADAAILLRKLVK